MGTTKRFEQELRLVSSSGIVFFMQHQARRPPAPAHSPPQHPCTPY